VLGLAVHDEVVEVLLGAGFLEREDALHNDEEDNSHGEQVYLSALVGLAFFNLGGHVSHGSAVGLEAVNGLVAGKAEVSDLDVEVLVNEDVFELEVAVDNSLAVHVLEGIEHLQSEKPTGVFAHAAHELAHVKKKSALDALHDDVDEVGDNAGAGLDHLTCIAKVEHLNDARVLQVL
jgi:hypothetical protein